MPIPRAQSLADYHKFYNFSVQHPEEFWFEEGQRLYWSKPYTRAQNYCFSSDQHYIKWFDDGELNVSENCLDRHLAQRGDQTAIIWQGDTPEESKKISYSELHQEVCRFANALKTLGIGKGDRVVIYLPMIIEAAVAMLACARIGAIHSIVFGGFSPESLASRIEDCQAKLVITSTVGYRGGKIIPLKDNVDQALTSSTTACVQTVVIVKRGSEGTHLTAREVWYHELIQQADEMCAAEPMPAEAPLFILYTSGSTGKPKGVVHTSGGYLLYAAMTFDHIFAPDSNTIFWCTADVGWITGHSYVVYGALSNGCTTLMYEGIPNYPAADRFWQIIDTYNVTHFYTAPTAIRSLIRAGDEYLQTTPRNSLKVLGSVGEPIDPTSWAWFYDHVGKGRCPIVDTWWQTETGGILISPLAGITPLKPGCATLPFYGIEPAIVDVNGQEIKGEGSGNLVLKTSWPGQARSLFKDHQRFIETYFSTYKDCYFTGDGCHRDEEGYYWITGRVDDVINVSGHRIGTAEVESVLNEHPAIVESAVVGFPHEIKGQGIYAYVIFDPHCPTQPTAAEINQWVRQRIGAIATLDKVHITTHLPKTRSGKVMRRILRKLAAGETENLGDLSTLLDPTIIDTLKAEITN
nr:acetate--CoA ligase [Candidatus Odyssella thessalonicensis]